MIQREILQFVHDNIIDSVFRYRRMAVKGIFLDLINSCIS